MDKFYAGFEKYVSYILMIIAMFFVCYQIADLTYHFVLRLVNNIQVGQFEMEEKGRPIAGLFFNILLLLEIIQTIRVFGKNHSVKVRIILIVGLIAVTRKILMIDMGEHDTMSEFAIAALIISLSAGYFLVSRSEKFNVSDD